MIVCAVSSWLSIDDGDFPRGLGEFFRHLSDHDDLIADLDDDRTKIEHDLAAVGLHELRLVVQQSHQLALGRGRDRDPRLLNLGALERGFRGPVRAGAREPRQNRGQLLLLRRQSIRDGSGNIDICVQPVDRAVRNLRPNRVVRDHLLRDRLEPVRVERGVGDEVPDRPDEREHDRHNGQGARADLTLPRRASALRDCLRVAHSSIISPHSRQHHHPLRMTPWGVSLE